jgi:site-specific DNA recombinase
VLVRDQYDDGGISGGTLERPGLQRLLEDIEDGLVDVVVVYKIDRLSRSLPISPSWSRCSTGTA